MNFHDSNIYFLSISNCNIIISNLNLPGWRNNLEKGKPVVPLINFVWSRHFIGKKMTRYEVKINMCHVSLEILSRTYLSHLAVAFIHQQIWHHEIENWGWNLRRRSFQCCNGSPSSPTLSMIVVGHTLTKLGQYCLPVEALGNRSLCHTKTFVRPLSIGAKLSCWEVCLRGELCQVATQYKGIYVSRCT